MAGGWSPGLPAASRAMPGPVLQLVEMFIQNGRKSPAAGSSGAQCAKMFTENIY
jgi:hypothetical protein